MFPPKPGEFTRIYDELEAAPNNLVFGDLETTGMALAQATLIKPDTLQILAATASASGQFPTAYVAQLKDGQVLAGMASDARQKGHGLDPGSPDQLLAAFQGKTFNLVSRGRRVRAIFNRVVEISTELLNQSV